MQSFPLLPAAGTTPHGGIAMSTVFPGFSSPLASTEAPLDMLAACHTRIEKQCATLTRLVPHLAEHGADEQATTAARNIMRYFDTAALMHHADEEENLFPELLESMAGSDAVCLRELTQGLTADHRRLEADWRHLRRALAEIANGRPADLSSQDVDAFVGLYAQHLQREDEELFPMAQRLLGDDALKRLGHAMSERRNILPARL